MSSLGVRGTVTIVTMTMRARFAAIVLMMLASRGVVAQQQRQGASDSVTVVPGASYAKGPAYRFFFGRHYRDLWTTPVRVAVLDLHGFAGGLTPHKKGGGQQTKTLRFRGADGREYVFRSLDKDPSIALPKGLRHTFADRIFQDQISSSHPGGPLVVPPILAAAGVPHAEPILAMMPDDPILGEYRAEFANLLGMIEERPGDADDDGLSFAGAREIVSTDEFFRRVAKDPRVRLDSRAFLVARLTDVFLGDWDRHREQWRWALLDSMPGARWVPIPRDRDQAFVRFDGLVLSFVRPDVPQLLRFGPRYGTIVGATWNGSDLDRRFLTDLEWPVWDSVARTLQSRLIDSVLENAVGRMPPEFFRIDGHRLGAALKARRDAIPAMARTFYDLLVGQVDVYASDQADVVRVTRADEHHIDVTVTDAPGAAPYYRRRFDARETTDLRVFLGDGDDQAVVDGPGTAGTTVRIIGGGGNDTFADSAAHGRSRFYDVLGTNAATGGSINSKPYQPVDDTTDATALPHRDWGRRTLTQSAASIGPDVGLLVSFGGVTTWYGFRRKPYASHLSYRAGFATGAATGRIDVDGRIQRENSRAFVGFEARASGMDVLRWYGFGNNTARDAGASEGFYRATQQAVSLKPTLGWYLTRHTLVTLGPSIKYSGTNLDRGMNAGRFIGQDRPYGTGNIVQAGLWFDVTRDGRDIPMAATRGVYLGLGGSYVPPVFDIDRAFGELHGNARAYLTATVPTEPTLALQVGGKKIWGTSGKIPFYEAAYLGSSHDLRGYRSYRFAGDASVYSSAELRLHLSNLFIFIPGKQGVFGFYDGGRVFLTGEPTPAPGTNRWHNSLGGGVWLSFLGPANVVTAAIGHSVEGNRLYIGLGFGY